MMKCSTGVGDGRESIKNYRGESRAGKIVGSDVVGIREQLRAAQHDCGVQGRLKAELMRLGAKTGRRGWDAAQRVGRAQQSAEEDVLFWGFGRGEVDEEREGVKRSGI
jgi:hypothetical protein